MKRFPLLVVAIALAVAVFALVAAAQVGGGGTGMERMPMPMDEGEMEEMIAGPMGGMMGGAAIAVSGDHIYVVAGGMLLKYDTDLNLVKQAELPMSEMASQWMHRRGTGRGMRGGRGRGGGRGGGGMHMMGS